MRRTLSLFALVSFAIAVALPARAVPHDAAPSIESLLHTAFTDYRSWGRVDDELRWAPWLCRMPLPSAARESRAEPGTPHAQKVFFVYARDREAYLATTARSGRAPIGEVVVKESFHPRELADGEQPPRNFPPAFGATELPRSPFPFQTLEHDGHRIGPGDFAGLYVLAKTGARGSDHGWEYGTLTPDGTITSMGRVASCMGCHDSSETHDRLFGLNGGFED